MDLVIVIFVFAAGSLSVPFLNPILRNGHGLIMVFAAAAFQFVLEGLAPLTLMALRREPFSDYGLIRRNVGWSLALGLAFALFYDLVLSWHAGAALWIPLQRQPAVRMSVAAGFPLGVAGLIVTVFTWGFLEGCFGIYFARKVNMMLGHSGCGAVKAAMKANAAPGQISVLYQHLQPGVAQSGGNIDKAIEANARIQAELLRTSSPVIREAIKAGELKVEAAVYDLATGKVTVS